MVLLSEIWVPFCRSRSAGLLLIYSLLPSLFFVVPLFLGLGILLCDNHFYYFHLPYPSFFGVIPLCQALGTLQRNIGAFVNSYFFFMHLFFTITGLHNHTCLDQWRLTMWSVLDYRQLSGAFLSLNTSITFLCCFLCIFIALRQFPWKRKTVYSTSLSLSTYFTLCFSLDLVHKTVY